MKCKKCGAEFEEGFFCPECGTRVENTETCNDETLKKQQEFKNAKNSMEEDIEEPTKQTEKAKKPKKKSKGKIFIFIVIAVVLLIIGKSCASSNGYGQKPQMGTYTIKEGKKYPYVYVNKVYGSSDDVSNLVFSVRPTENEDAYSMKEATLRSDGTYCIEGSSWNYILSFNGNGKVKVELEKTGDSAIVNAITKHTLKKAVGTYKYFEADVRTVDDTLQEMGNVLD